MTHKNNMWQSEPYLIWLRCLQARLIQARTFTEPRSAYKVQHWKRRTRDTPPQNAGWGRLVGWLGFVMQEGRCAQRQQQELGQVRLLQPHPPPPKGGGGYVVGCDTRTWCKIVQRGHRERERENENIIKECAFSKDHCWQGNQGGLIYDNIWSLQKKEEEKNNRGLLAAM